jgi:hypothetical protein
MKSSLTQLRPLLLVGAILTVSAVASGCGGGVNTQAAAQAPPLVKYASSFLSFTHPMPWKAYSFQWPGELHFRPLVYLSTQPVHNPCLTNGNTTTCGFPVGRLHPGGVLVAWNAGDPFAAGLGRGTQVQVDGRPARRVDLTNGICNQIGADRTIDVRIATSPLPSGPTEFTACLRGPGLAQNVKRVDALLASTKFLS